MDSNDGLSGARIDIGEIAIREQWRCRLPSLVVAAARDGADLDSTVVGLANVEDGVDAETGTAYRIGSITKTFTAVIVLTLAERGELGLDAPVGAYLSGTSFGDVPLRYLLAHSGGLQREVPVDMWESMRGPDRAELRAAFGKVELVDGPGARWHYSNLGYAVLGQIVEDVTGTSCAELIDTQLLSPLGLTSTSWVRPPAAAVGYRVDPYADIVHREPDMDQASVGVAGQLWSTADDLLAWGHALAGGSPDVVSPRVVDAMHTLQVMVDRRGWTSGWGLGLILDRRPSCILAGHTGAMPGFLSGLSIERESRSVAVVLTNVTRGAAVGRLAADVAERVAAARPEPKSPWRPSAAYPAELRGVLGRWWSEADETVFTWRTDGLHAYLASAPETSDTRFGQEAADTYRAVAGRMTGERLLVRRDRDGNVVGLEWATYPFTRSPR
ncbi:serine hydrolase domain-containing protein [Pseudonocardia aurantiaca]|uniref:Serine hydrolase domain-containing protein n=1 Tax=Pseudonocardia aurantiaca TaxID=75290 RepID=A0ABW4FMX2_9PSEU